MQFSVTVGRSPSLGENVFLETQKRRDMFANKADTISSSASWILEDQ